MGCIFLLIKSFKISKKFFIVFAIFIIVFSSIIIFNSFADENNDIEEKKDFIKWVDFNITADALNKTAKLDIDSHCNNSDIKYNWIELLAYLACKNGRKF